MNVSAKKGTNKIMKIWFALLYIKEGIGFNIFWALYLKNLYWKINR